MRLVTSGVSLGHMGGDPFVSPRGSAWRDFPRPWHASVSSLGAVVPRDPHTHTAEDDATHDPSPMASMSLANSPEPPVGHEDTLSLG